MLKKLTRLLGGRLSIHGTVAQATSAADVLAALEALPSLGAKVEYLRCCRQFRVDQHKPEFMQFLAKIQDKQPKRIVEIGGRRGGSALLMSIAAPDAQIVSMDIDSGPRRQRRLGELCAGRTVQFWQGDSHAPATLDRFRDWLTGDGIDVLFIDGDHSFEGAKQDFCMYLPLVNDGGLIAMHDIQPDYKARFQVPTLCWSGGVPELWTTIRDAGFQCENLVSDEWQDGYGIGVVTKSANDAVRATQLNEPSKVRRAA